MHCIIATLGFDIDHLARRLSREPKPSRIICLGLRVDETAWSRVEKAFSLLKAFFCKSLNASCTLEELSAQTLVREIAGIIDREARSGCSEIELYLTGGPRIAVVASLIAALTSIPSAATKVVVEGETFDARLEIPLEPLKRLLSLPELERRILVEAQEPVKPTELHKKLGVNKPVIYRKLRALKEIGLLEASEAEDRYVAREEVKNILRLIA